MPGTVGQNDWRVQPDNTLQVVNPKTPQRKGIVSEVHEPQKNYRGLLIAWLIIFVVLLAVVISVVIIGVRDPRHVLIGRRLTVLDVLQNPFRTPPFFAAWRGDKLVYKDSTGDLREYDSRRNSSRVVFRLPKEEPVGDIDTLISSNGRYVLERRRTKYGLRGSSEAQYTVQDVSNGHQFPVHLFRDTVEDPYLQLAVFSPRRRPPAATSASGDTYSLAVVYRGDIYLLPLATLTTELVRLTDTGTADGTVLNGVTNWWYRETSFVTPQAMWFSASGSQLMFVTFNDSSLSTVETLTYPRGGEIIRRKMAYPKRSGALTEISISICDVEKTVAASKPHIVELNLRKMSNQNGYLTEVQWVGDDTVAVSLTARDLTSGRISLCKGPTWRCTEVYAAAGRRWISELRPVFAGGRADFIVRMEDTGEHGTEMVEVEAGGDVKVRHKTEGHTISSILFWDWEDHWIYYTGVEGSRLSETHLFRRPDSKAGRLSAAVCLTCHSSALSGRRCDTVRTFFPPPPPPPPPPPAAAEVGTGAGDAIALECTEGAVRRLLVADRGVRASLAVLDDSDELVARVSRVAAPHLLRETVILGGETVQLEVMLPKLWDEKKGGSYLFPFVLVIEDDVLELNWSQQFATFMVSKWDLVFVRVKSSAQLSRRSFFENQKRTSHIFSHLLDNYPYLDRSRPAVLGTGLGGHTALVAMADSPLVDCGAVIWPVVELDLYDAYHAERYEDTTNILDAIERLADHSLFLVYGTGDPLFLHGHLLSKKLVEVGVLYYQQIYSDEDVYFRSVSSHLMKSLEDFLIPKCFAQLIAKKSDDE